MYWTVRNAGRVSIAVPEPRAGEANGAMSTVAENGAMSTASVPASWVCSVFSVPVFAAFSSMYAKRARVPPTA